MRQLTINAGLIELLEGDITQVQADAIVNAANTGLRGGGGVDGAIHRAGGPAILAELIERYPHGTTTGNAVPTGAGRLKASWVIHAVAPVYRDGNQGEADLLRQAYSTALRRASELGAHSVAFPSLGTGIYNNPLAASAIIAVEEAIGHLKSGQPPIHIMFVLFNHTTLAAFETALNALDGSP